MNTTLVGEDKGLIQDEITTLRNCLFDPQYEYSSGSEDIGFDQVFTFCEMAKSITDSQTLKAMAVNLEELQNTFDAVDGKFKSTKNEDKYDLYKLPKLKYPLTSNVQRNGKLNSIVNGIVQGIYDTEAVKAGNMSIQAFTQKFIVNVKKAFKAPSHITEETESMATETWRFIVMSVSCLLLFYCENICIFLMICE